MHKTQDLPCPPKSDDDEEPLGTVCECCWKNIPNPDDVWYAEDGTAMCEDCFRYHEGDVCAEEHQNDSDDKRLLTIPRNPLANPLRHFNRHISLETEGKRT